MTKRLLTILGLSANLFLTGCADDQARQQIADTNQRLNQIQQNVGVLDNKVSNQKMLDLLNQINDLQTQISQINGRVTNLEQGQSSGQGDQSQQLQALDLRISALESASNDGAMPKANPAVRATGMSSASSAELQAAIKKIQANDLDAAITQLKELIDAKDKATAANARYFLAVAYVANSQYTEAIDEANQFINANAKNKYVPDALRVIYIAQGQLGNTTAASNTAKRLIKSYPNSSAAKKVAKQLQQ